MFETIDSRKCDRFIEPFVRLIILNFEIWLTEMLFKIKHFHVADLWAKMIETAA